MFPEGSVDRRSPIMPTLSASHELWPLRDVEDLLVLARFVAAGRNGGRPATVAHDPGEAVAYRRLAERCALVPKPRAPGGHVASLIGVSRLYRFVHAPLGIAEDMSIDREVAVRRILLDVLNPPDRHSVEARMCAELVEIRAGIFRCAHADLCAGRGCPFELDVSADAVDRALASLLPTGN